ncbi:MbnP family protein [uncultured Capnocytophaga sp.]|uniref:MbnP family protein n=1 Tax=uncultured Capnocytophaga sp. TaxID=159273 RepID=UPI0026181F07|nr:MbnP family protein [uncultured Capnocytophaga sp.]
MRKFKTLLMAITTVAALSSCSKKDDNNDSTPAKVSLQFDNYVGTEKLALGASASAAKAYTSNGQTLKFSEVKYVITNVVLVKADGTKVPYHTEDLDKGGFLINQAKTASLTPVLSGIPEGEYKGIEFGLGVKKELNNLKLQDKFPNFYRLTGEFKHSGIMHWEWANGYRFVKLEGWYSNPTPGKNKKGEALPAITNGELSIHIGSAFKGTKVIGEDKKVKGIENETLNIDRDAFRFVSLDFPKNLSVKGGATAKVTIKADFDKLINGTNKISLNGKIPVVHSLNNMFPFVNNIGGNQDLEGKKIIVKDINDPQKAQEGFDNSESSALDKAGMFSVLSVE